MNLAWWLEKATWEHADKVAVIDGVSEEKVTYLELNRLSNRIGNILTGKFGVREDDVVVTILPENHWHMAIMYGAMKIGAIFSGLNRTQVFDKFKFDVQTSNARTIIVNKEFLDIARALKKEACVDNVLVCDDNVTCEFPNLKEIVWSASDKLRIVPRSNSEAAAINFTAGTAGPSKGVVFTHGTLGTSALGAVFWDGIISSDLNICFISLFHSGGIHDAIKWVIAGGTLVWSGGWNAERAVHLIKKYKPTFIYFWVPTMIRDLMRRPEWADLDLNGVRTNLAGEPVPIDVHEAVAKKGLQAADGYGMTETMPVGVLKPSLYYEDNKIVPYGCPGKPNKEFCEVKLKDPLTGEEITSINEKGEICVRGDVVTPGYFNNPTANEAAFDDEGFLHTRDLAYIDENGWHWVGGRADDIISSGAEKLSLIEVDDLLLKHPKVKDAACIGVKHDRFGEVPAAFVVLSEPMSEEDARDMLDEYCMTNFERWKRPRLYAVVDEIPRTMAKKTKNLPELRKAVEGIILREKDGVVTYSQIRLKSAE